MKNFMVTVDQDGTNLTFEQITEFISSHRNVQSWLAPYRGTLILKVDESDFFEVYISIRRLMGESSFIIAEINIESTAGILTETMWEWINESVLPEEGAEVIRGNRVVAGSDEQREFENKYRGSGAEFFSSDEAAD